MTIALPAPLSRLRLALLLAFACAASAPAFAQQPDSAPAQGQAQTDDHSPQTVDDPIRPARPLPGEQPAFVDARELFGPDAATNKSTPDAAAAPTAAPAADGATQPAAGLPATPPTNEPADTAEAAAPADVPQASPRAETPVPALPNLAPDTTSDPPTRVGRIAALDGPVSFQPAGQPDFAPAEVNFPVTTGDRLYAAPGSRAALEAGTVSLRLGPAADLSVTQLDDSASHFGLAQGSLHLRTLELDENAPVELDTPTVSLLVLEPGDLRVDVDPRSGATSLSVLSGKVQVLGIGDFDKTFSTGQAVRLELQPGDAAQSAGDAALQVTALDPAGADALDAFSQQLDTETASADQADADAIDDRTVGAADLADNGDWTADSTYGIVWYPRGVAVDWQPFRDGHWAFLKPWGWTWVPAEPWGFAPAHYGRWARINGRWGWVPGPRGVRPVWAPALVGFAGGDKFAARIGYRGGIAAWFPLAPNEPYTPPFRHSALYANRVNAANLYTRDTRQARSTYNQRTLAAAYQPQASPRFANFTALTVVPEAVFAAGRSVEPNAVQLQNGDLELATLLPRPSVTPTREVGVAADLRALPPHIDRVAAFHQASPAPTPSVQHRSVPPIAVASDEPAPIERREPAHAAQPAAQSDRPQGYMPTPNPRSTVTEMAPAQPRTAPAQPEPQPQQPLPDREYRP